MDAAPRLLVVPQHLVEPEQPNEVAALERDPRQQQAGVDRVIEPRQAIDRLDHEVTGVESEHDRMVTFDAKLLAQQFAMARSKANENLHKLSPILYDTLGHIELMPYRECATPEELQELQRLEDESLPPS